MIIRNCCLAGAWLIAVAPTKAADVGTAFTYQGFLEKPAGTAVTDTCAFEFALCDDAAAACSPGTVSSHPAVAVTDGVFTVPDVDFGAAAFTGEARWMEIFVQCSGDASFVTLPPRVKLKPAPYALRAGNGIGGLNALNVTPSGDVGIGTNAPAAQLDVNGAVRATTVEITGGSNVVSLVAWGWNAYGQTAAPFETFTTVSSGSYHNLAILNDGTLVGWGLNNLGQIDVPDGTFIVADGGEDHSLAIRSDGTLAGWGSNSYGQIDVPAGTFTAVAGGGRHSLAIRTDGTLVGWGNNSSGQTNVPSGTFTAVAAGTEHSLALRDDGTLVGWGSNGWGQTNVPSGTYVAIAAGGAHSLAIRTDGTLIGWGYNDFGQTDVPEGNFTAVAAGSYYGLAIRSDGTLAGWGSNFYGETDVPLGTFTAVTAGWSHALAIPSEPPSQPDPALRLHTDSAVKPGSNTWTIYSDRRLKKNITPLSGALDHLLQLRGVTFNWIDPASQGGITGTQMGLIADEVQRVFPQWVGRDPKGYQTLTVAGFEALTTEALRDLRAEKDRQLAELQERETAKDRRINELEARLAAIEALMNRSSNANKGGAQ